ncbi:MAG: hypothetical protein ACYSU4_01470 [Planctomycetota bacterium]|jgi:hypothetical protein
MKSRKKKILIGCGIGIAIVLIFIAGFATGVFLISDQHFNHSRVKQASSACQYISISSRLRDGEIDEVIESLDADAIWKLWESSRKRPQDISEWPDYIVKCWREAKVYYEKYPETFQGERPTNFSDVRELLKKIDQADDAQQAAASEAIENIDVSEKSDLRILYVGLPDTERQKDFVAFLGKHFKQVDTADYYAFTEEQTKDCDVAIFDKDGIEWAPLEIDVSDRYSRATVSIGVPGAFWVEKVSRKMGYM